MTVGLLKSVVSTFERTSGEMMRALYGCPYHLPDLFQSLNLIFPHCKLGGNFTVLVKYRKIACFPVEHEPHHPNRPRNIIVL